MNRYIDVDKFCEKAKKISDSAYSDSPVTRRSINLVFKWMKEFAYGRENAYGEKIPPVPYAINIVRCEDCIHYDTKEELCRYSKYAVCREKNDFCSRGEKET